MSMRNNRNIQNQSMQDQCRNLMHYHVVFIMADGCKLDGIIESVNENEVTVLIGEFITEEDLENNLKSKRQYGYPTRYRRYGRRVIPLIALASLGLLPYPYYPPPYYPPYYPYY